MKRSPNYFEDYFEHLLKNLMLETIKRALRQLILNLLQRENTENSRELCIRGVLEERAINGGKKRTGYRQQIRCYKYKAHEEK